MQAYLCTSVLYILFLYTSVHIPNIPPSAAT
jgi:hypothetical protein